MNRTYACYVSKHNPETFSRLCLLITPTLSGRRLGDGRPLFRRKLRRSRRAALLSACAMARLAEIVGGILDTTR
jgi:hypothetical protein